MTAESVGDLAIGAGIALGGSPGGVTTVVRSAKRVAEFLRSPGAGGVRRPLVESTHRHDKETRDTENQKQRRRVRWIILKWR
jgi:hypothetical protein